MYFVQLLLPFFLSANLNILSFLNDMILFLRGPVGGPVATGSHSRRFPHLGSLNLVLNRVGLVMR